MRHSSGRLSLAEKTSGQIRAILAGIALGFLVLFATLALAHAGSIDNIATANGTPVRGKLKMKVTDEVSIKLQEPEKAECPEKDLPSQNNATEKAFCKSGATVF